jgi:phospholipase C
MSTRTAPVEHMNENEATLTAARPDGSLGGEMTITFHPAPGTGRVASLVNLLPSQSPPGEPDTGRAPTLRGVAVPEQGPVVGLGTAGTPATVLANDVLVRPVPRVALARPGRLTDDGLVGGGAEVDPPIDPGQPQSRLRIRIGPVGGPLETIAQRPGLFSVPGIFGSTGSTAGNEAGSTGAGIEGGQFAQTDENSPAATLVGPWECRIANVSPDDAKVFAQVFYPVRRRVTATRIPRTGLTRVFEGALRGLTPSIEVAAGDVVVTLPAEASELGVEPVVVDLAPVGATAASVVFQPVDFEMTGPERMYRDAFTDLRDELPRVALASPEDFVDDMLDAAMAPGGRDLLKRASELLRSSPEGKVAGKRLDGLFTTLDMPRRTSSSAPGAGLVSDDVALRASITVDQLSFGADAAIAAFQLFAEALQGRLDVHLGTRRAFVPHPLSTLPDDDPRAALHRQELTTETRVTWTSRFAFTIDDIDTDIDVGDLFLSRVVNDVLDWTLDQFDWLLEERAETTIRNAVRQFLHSNEEVLATHAGETLVELAQRQDLLHDVFLDGPDLVIEHYDPLERRPVQPPKAPARPLRQPIDGLMPTDADQRLEAIDHIVVVMMENRSFDHMLGWLSHPEQFTDVRRRDVDGLTGDERIPRGKGDVTGTAVEPTFAPQAEWLPDPDHGHRSTALQLGDGLMDGFIPAYRQRLAESPAILRQGVLDDEARIVQCQPAVRLPIYDYIARQFCVLDRWFASFPGATFVNRMCELAGFTTALENSELTPDLGYLTTPTLFDLLDRARVAWVTYESDVTFQRAFDSHRLDFERIRPITEFFDGDDPLPPVTFVDPNVTGLPSQAHADDDHPPTDVAWGQAFLQRVLDRVRQPEAEWRKTMLIITYDEHGGFYDHVAPPGTAMFHAAHPEIAAGVPRVHPDEASYGVRVPTMLISPLVAARSTGHRIYDHTTIMRTVLQRFAPEQLALAPQRVRMSRHLGELLTGPLRTDIPAPPRSEAPPDIRVRSNATTPGADLSAITVDSDDARFFLARIGVPQRGGRR